MSVPGVFGLGESVSFSPGRGPHSQEPMEEPSGVSPPGSARPMGHSGVLWTKGRVRLECENPLPGDPKGLPAPFPRGMRWRGRHALGAQRACARVGGISVEDPEDLWGRQSRRGRRERQLVFL